MLPRCLSDTSDAWIDVMYLQTQFSTQANQLGLGFSWGEDFLGRSDVSDFFVLTKCFSASLTSPAQNPGNIIFLFFFSVALLNFSYILNSIPHKNTNVCRKLQRVVKCLFIYNPKKDLCLLSNSQTATFKLYDHHSVVFYLHTKPIMLCMANHVQPCCHHL